MAQYASNQGLVYEILYYIEGDTNIYGSQNNGNLRDLGETVYPFADWKDGKIAEELAKANQPVVKPSETIKSVSGSSRELIRYIYPMRDVSPSVTFVVLIDGAELRKLLDTSESFFTENFYILNEQNEPLISLRETEGDMAKIDLNEVVQQLDRQTLSTHKIKGTRFYAVVSRAALSGRCYIALVDKHNIDQSLMPVIVGAFIAGILIMAAGSVIIWAAMGMTYKPLKHIISELRQKDGDEKTYQDDFAYIENVVNRYFAENQEMEKTLQEHAPIIKNYVINELLKGRTQNIENLYEPEKSSFGPEQVVYFAVIFSFQAKQDVDFQKSKQIILECVDEQFRLEYFDFANHTDAVCIFSQKPETDKKKQVEYLKKIQARIVERLGVESFVSIGSLCRDFFQIGQSYIEATAVQKQKMAATNRVERFENKDRETMDYTEYARYYRLVHNLSLQLDNRNIEAVKFSVERIINSMSMDEVPPFIKRCIVFEVFNTLIKVMMEYEVKFNGSHLLNLAEASLEDIGSADALHKFLGKICIDVCDYICQSENKEDAVMRQMNEFIDAHYKEDDFSLTKMADSLNVSVQYLCEHYKRNTGETIINYVFYKRMEEAKRLLAETDMPVKDIAKAVGYIDTSNFGKRFKSRQGVTPKNYRDMHKGGKDQDNGGKA